MGCLVMESPSRIRNGLLSMSHVGWAGPVSIYSSFPRILYLTFEMEHSSPWGLNYIDVPMDSIPHTRMWNRAYTVDLKSMDMNNTNAGIPAPSVPGISVYTDGSKSGHNTGAGIAFHMAACRRTRGSGDQGSRSWVPMVKRYAQGCAWI